MLLGIDHLIVAVADPDAAVEELGTAFGVTPGGGGEHPAWGTRNRLLWLGDTYVELLGIMSAGLARKAWLGAPAARQLEHGPGLVGWGIATDDIESDAVRLRRAGAALGPMIDGERRRSDGKFVRWRLTLPPRINLTRPFLIEHDASAAEWTPADRQARSAKTGRLVELHLPIDGVHGLSLGSHDHALMLGDQRIVASGLLSGDPVIRLTGLGPTRRLSSLGCAWSIE